MQITVLKILLSYFLLLKCELNLKLLLNFFVLKSNSVASQSGFMVHVTKLARPPLYDVFDWNRILNATPFVRRFLFIIAFVVFFSRTSYSSVNKFTKLSKPFYYAVIWRPTVFKCTRSNVERMGRRSKIDSVYQLLL